jgi:hypothetical protein
MRHAIPSNGFAADLKAVNEDAIVVLHRFKDGMLLVMIFDDEMPPFTTREVIPGELPSVPEGKDSLTSATGYVFWIAQEDKAGTFDFEGRQYAFLDIEDYVLWTDETAVRGKYDEVCKKARGA